MTTTAGVASGPSLVHSLSTFRKCASCGKALPVHRRKGAAPKHCQTRRCRKIYYSGRQRTKSGRCGDPLARAGGPASGDMWTMLR